MNLLQNIQTNGDKLVTIINQDFGLMDEVCSWENDLQALKSIKGKRYQMLMQIYSEDELDKLYDWIEKISSRNKFMEGLQEVIQQLNNKDQDQFLEADKHYNATSLEIFEDESNTKVSLVKIVV